MTPPREKDDEMRQAFEAWALKRYLPEELDRSPHVEHQYRNQRTHEQWEAWRAAYAAGLEAAVATCVSLPDSGTHPFWDDGCICCAAAIRALKP